MLDGISLAGYRSFSSNTQLLSDMAKVNVIIGKNNSGKSNVLRFLCKIPEIWVKTAHDVPNKPLFDPLLDLHKGLENCSEIKFSLLIKKESPVTGEAYKGIQLFELFDNQVEEWQKGVWIPYKINMKKGNAELDIDNLKQLLNNSYEESQIRHAFHKTGWSGGTHESRLEHILPQFDVLSRFNYQKYFIPAFRQITNENSEWELSGKGLIKKFNELKNPVVGKEEDRKKYDQINRFLQDILGDKDAKLDIPYTVNELYVEMDNRRLPLKSLGTGIHQVILLAAAVTLLENAVICIEELEIYLHPELQKKFLNYITQHTNNQYFVTTHSNAVFDCDNINIYHCWLEAGHTRCSLASKASHKRSILDDLGYKASDILQSNCIIWVEGPADRLYINRWIKDKAPELREGLEYSIMFYGGRLLNHLSVNDEEIDAFINLGCMNRNVAIIIDSDRKTAHAHLNDTKKRIIKEFEDRGSFCWVTKGREIENYISKELFHEAVSKLYGMNLDLRDWAQFEDVTKFKQNSKEREVDKIRIAKEIIGMPSDFSMLDLESKVCELVSFVRRSNKSSSPRV
jgi:predicted ATP-dependent endonuclease of OLD family